MEKSILFITLLLVLPSVKNGYCAKPVQVWSDIGSDIHEADLRTLAVNPQNPDIIYAGSKKTILKSPDGGQTWQRLYLIRGTFTAVNVIAISPINQDLVYAGTQNGLFASPDAGITWNRLFEGLGPQEKEIRHMAIDPRNAGKIYIGTASGLFISDDAGKTWNKSGGEISNQIINFIAIDPFDSNIIYTATQKGVYKSKGPEFNWNRIFLATDQTEGNEMEEPSNDTNTDEIATFSNKTPNCIALDNRDANKIYIGTNSGVFVSSDGGETCSKMTNTGLLNRKITSLISLSDKTIYTATNGGIFKISKPYTRWDEIYQGLASKDVRYFAYDQKNNFILAVTKNSVYKACVDSSLDADLKNQPIEKDPEIGEILTKFKSEPGIQEVQEAAIKYAEVHKEKIDEWRKSAKRRALLPTLSVSMDHGVKSTSEIYTSATQHYWTEGPSDNSTGWDVRVSWDLGDLIWNDDQTNIDVRSRLMVQLRDDILNEVTRLYFERRKLQIELLTTPPKETRAKIEKELRLQELTAGIDALTGGWFSKRIEETKNQT